MNNNAVLDYPLITINDSNVKLDVYGAQYISIILECNIENKVLDEFIKDVLDRLYHHLPKDGFISAIPKDTIVSVRAIAQSILYTLKYMKYREKIRNPGLLLLSILYCRKQLKEVIDLVNRFIENTLLLVIVASQNLDLTSVLSRLPYCRRFSGELDINHSALKYIYNIDPSSMDYSTLEKTLLTMITRGYLEKL